MRLKFAMGAIGRRLAVALQAFAVASTHAAAIRHLAETRFCEHTFTLLQLPAAGRQRRRDGRGSTTMPPRLAGSLQLGGRERIGATPPTACRTPPDVSGGNTAGNRSSRRTTCANRTATQPRSHARGDHRFHAKDTAPAVSAGQPAYACAIASSASNAGSGCWARSKRSRAARMPAWFSPAQLSSCETGPSRATPSLDSAYSTLGGLVA